MRTFFTWIGTKPVLKAFKIDIFLTFSKQDEERYQSRHCYNFSKRKKIFPIFINFFHKSRENKILRQKYKDQRKTWSIYSIYQETTRKVKTHYSLKITQENHKPDDYQIQSFFCLIFLFHISKFFRKKLCRKDKKEMMIKCCDINNSQRKQKNPFSKLKYSIIVKSKNGIYLSSKTLLLTER